MKFTVTAEIEATTAAEAISILCNGAPAKAPVAAVTPAKAPALAAAPAVTQAAAPAPAAPAPAASSGPTDVEMRAVLAPLMTGANVPIKGLITQLIQSYAATLTLVVPDQRPELLRRAKAIAADFDATGVAPTELPQ